MSHALLETEDAVTLEPQDTARASVIWLHGLGADGYDFVPVVPELRLPPALAVRFVFPHATVRPVTINDGYAMRAWYDITELSAAGRDTATGLEDSVVRIHALVDAEIARGIVPSRIVLAGFSQGGAVALHAGLSATERTAGIIALSSYLPRTTDLLSRPSHTNRSVPVLMCHGTEDPIVDIAMGIAARDALVASGHPVEWHSYPMAHEVSGAEIRDLARWVVARLE